MRSEDNRIAFIVADAMKWAAPKIVNCRPDCCLEFAIRRDPEGWVCASVRQWKDGRVCGKYAHIHPHDWQHVASILDRALSELQAQLDLDEVGSTL